MATWTADSGQVTADSGTFTADGSGFTVAKPTSTPLLYFWLSKAPPQVVGIGQVQGLSATALSSTSVQLSWIPVTGATSYQVYRNTVPTAVTDGTPFIDTGLTPSTLYDYSVAAQNSSGTGLHATDVTVTTLSGSTGGGGSGAGFDITASSTLPANTLGLPYHILLGGPASSPPYMWSFTNTAQNTDYFLAPSGNAYALTYDGWLECAPTVAATDVLAVYRRAIDNTSISNLTLSLTHGSTLRMGAVSSDLTVTPLPSAQQNVKYKAIVFAAGGATTHTFTISAGSLPTGLSLNTVANQGVITGTPTASPATSTFTVQVSDGSTTATAQYSIKVSAQNNAARPAGNTGSGFYVAGGVLRSPDGNEFRIRGINRCHWDSDGWIGGQNGALSRANACRTFVDWTKPVAANTGNNTHGSGASLTSENILNGIVAIPCFDNDDNGTDVAGITNATGFWTSQAAGAGGWLSIQNDMILNVSNEWGPSNSTVWRDTYITAIASLRAAGYTCPILIDSGGSGQDIADLVTYAPAVLASDPQKNIVFAYHLYGRTGINITSMITGVATGSSTTLTYNSQLSGNPFLNGTAFQSYCSQATLSGFTGAYSVLNGGPYALSSGGGSSGAWTVKAAVDSTGLPAYNGSFGGQIIGYAPASTICSILGSLRAQGICVIVGEFGPGNPPLGNIPPGDGQTGPSPTTVTPAQIVTAAEENGLGWLYWAWDDHSGNSVFFGFSTWFSATQGNGGFFNGNVTLLTINGLDIVTNPIHGLWGLAVPSSKYL